MSSASHKLPVPCIMNRAGDHLMAYSTFCRPSEITTLLGHDPRSKNWKALPAPLRDLYQDYQRKTKPARAETIYDYIGSRMAPHATMPGAFPSLSIGLTLSPTFEPLSARAGIMISPGVTIGDNIGTVYLDLGISQQRMLLDGLARVTGAMDFIDKGHNIDEWFTFNVTIFAPSPEKGRLSPQELGQLFFDFNYRVSRVPPSKALELDLASPYSRITDWLKDQPVIRDHGGMQQSGASLGTKSTALVVRRVLLGFVTIAAEGEKALQGAKNEEIRNPLTNGENIDDTQERIAKFLACFVDKMGAERFRDENSIHLTRTGWEAIGMIAHDVMWNPDTRPQDIERVAEALAAVDWSRTNSDWFGKIGSAWVDKEGNPKLDPQGREQVVISGGKGDRGLKSLITYLRRKSGSKKVGEDELLAA